MGKTDNAYLRQIAEGGIGGGGASATDVTDGMDAAEITANIGSTTPTNAILDSIDGDEGGAAALLLDPAAQSGNTATAAYDLNTLMRWNLKLLQVVGRLNYQANNWVPGTYSETSTEWDADGTASGYFTVPDTEFWQPICAQVTIATSATAGTRRVQYYVADSVGVVYDRSILEITQAASLTYRYVFGVGKPQSSAPISGSNIIHMPITPMIWPENLRLYFQTGAAQTGDTIEVKLSVLRRKEGLLI